MDDMAKDMASRLDWVAAEHWNTDNPHIHILVRGKTFSGEDLVIDRDYIRHGLRHRAEERVTVELGIRNERELHAATQREVSAERWTGLDSELAQIQEHIGIIDLRHDPKSDLRHQAMLVGRANTLARLGLANELDPGRWVISDNAEQTLRAIEMRGDIIKTMHRAMTHPQLGEFSTLHAHHEPPKQLVIGRLLRHRSLPDATGGSSVLIEGLDGNNHHLTLQTSDPVGGWRVGAIVQVESSKDGIAQPRLTTLSEMPLAQQVTANGLTWLDQQLVSTEPKILGGAFGQDVQNALTDRAAHLIGQGLASRCNGQIVVITGLLDELRQRDIGQATETIKKFTGLEALPSRLGDHIAGIYREQVQLNSGRFAMVENGLGFQLVPWEPALERRLGQSVSGIVNDKGFVDWDFDRSRSLGL